MGRLSQKIAAIFKIFGCPIDHLVDRNSYRSKHFNRSPGVGKPADITFLTRKGRGPTESPGETIRQVANPQDVGTGYVDSERR